MKEIFKTVQLAVDFTLMDITLLIFDFCDLQVIPEEVISQLFEVCHSDSYEKLDKNLKVKKIFIFL